MLISDSFTMRYNSNYAKKRMTMRVNYSCNLKAQTGIYENACFRCHPKRDFVMGELKTET